ncbi:ABC transporter permease [Actinophytocola oryzae]|uniref:ABC-2 type transport system permease protein n=1 Tax=Actinophytocola oryzae TaxID=502181 RepID=A0A4R7UW96_9PSEU|nr:ABC-2 family transporter protein [Actinophytocola oryzae]TDV40317.1 ABC-2 type transport system permease protein [Actinophytocola oryzae]
MSGDHVQRDVADDQDAHEDRRLTGVIAGGSARVLAALAGAEFRRYVTYRQATFAGAFTNTIFGFMRCYVLLSVASATGQVAGYDASRLVAFVWIGQGLLAVVNYWGQQELPERVRSGQVMSDLLRPVDLMNAFLASDVGRAGHAMVTRFVVPVVAGIVFFDFYLPGHAQTYALFAVSVLLAVLVCSACRYLVALTSFWLLDIRGMQGVWLLLSGVGSGLYFPLPVLPDWLVTLLWVGTPLPALLQAPLDVFVERGGTGHGLVLVAGQVAWLAIMVGLCRLVQGRALRRLVVQGG